MKLDVEALQRRAILTQAAEARAKARAAAEAEARAKARVLADAAAARRKAEAEKPVRYVVAPSRRPAPARFVPTPPARTRVKETAPVGATPSFGFPPPAPRRHATAVTRVLPRPAGTSEATPRAQTGRKPATRRTPTKDDS